MGSLFMGSVFMGSVFMGSVFMDRDAAGHLIPGRSLRIFWVCIRGSAGSRGTEIGDCHGLFLSEKERSFYWSTACTRPILLVKNEYSVYDERMPKVTDAHRESRREQILIAAWKCFSRNGFHSTSMADVIREADLSAGAVYLYFRSKDEIIVAVATQVFGGVKGRLNEFAKVEPPPSPAEIAAFLVRQPVLARAQTPADLFPLLLDVWSEATRNPLLIPVAEQILGGLRTQIAQMLERWMAATGAELPMTQAELTPVFLSLVQGFVMQHALSGMPLADDYETAVVALFNAAGLGPR